MNKTALVYVRVSRLDAGDRQRLREGEDLRALSPATQVAQCRALPAVRGMKVEVIEDLHRSGKTTKRPGLELLRARLGDPDVAAVAVWSISRLGRSVVDLYTLLEEMRAAGVAFVSAKESIDTSTPTGRAFVGMLAIVAQLERELTSERVRDNVEQAARSGELVGMLPYGYTRESGQVVVDEGEAAVVRLIFAKYATGTMSYRELARWLNAEGIRSPSFGLGRKNDRADWVMDAVREILARETYVGRFVHGRGRSATRRGRGVRGPAIAGNYLAIIDEATWQACVALRRKNGTHHMTVGADRTSRYALTGLLRCDRCGGTVHGVTTGAETRRRDYYSCRRRLGARACAAPFVKSDRLEDEVRDWLAAVRLPAGFAEAFADALAAAPAEPHGKGRAERRRELERRRERVADLYELGHVARDMYLAKRSELEAAIAALEELPEDRRSLPVLSRQIGSIIDDWDRMTTGQRRRVLATMFDELVVDGQLVAATPKAGWLEYLEAATSPPLSHVGREGIEPPQPKGG